MRQILKSISNVSEIRNSIPVPNYWSLNCHYPVSNSALKQIFNKPILYIILWGIYSKSECAVRFVQCIWIFMIHARRRIRKGFMNSAFTFTIQPSIFIF